jgi:hypothetical protein
MPASLRVSERSLLHVRACIKLFKIRIVLNIGYNLLKYRIQFKILLLTFKAIHGMAPDYTRADGAKRRARVLIPPGYLHQGKRKH